MRIYIHIYICIHLYIYIKRCIDLLIHPYIHTMCICEDMYIYVCIDIWVYISGYLYMYIFTRSPYVLHAKYSNLWCTDMYMYIFIYIRMCIYIHALQSTIHGI